MTRWEQAKRDREQRILSRKRTTNLTNVRVILANPKVPLRVKLYVARAYPSVWPGKIISSGG